MSKNNPMKSTERLLRRKLSKVINDNLDGIYKSSKTIAGKWGLSHIPLVMLKEIVDEYKPKNDESNPAMQNFNEKYVVLLDSFMDGCKQSAKKMGVNYIPIVELKTGLNSIKTAFKDYVTQ